MDKQIWRQWLALSSCSISFMMLVSCTDNNTDHNAFFLNPEQAYTQVETCENPHHTHVGSLVNCSAAIAALSVIKKELQTITQHPKAYGLAIMHTQQRIDLLQQQLNDGDLSNEEADALTLELSQKNQLLQHNYAMLRLAGE